MKDINKKVLTGFRLSEDNMKFIEDTSKKLGLSRTSVIDMLLTVVKKDGDLLPQLIRNALLD